MSIESNKRVGIADLSDKQREDFLLSLYDTVSKALSLLRLDSSGKILVVSLRMIRSDAKGATACRPWR